MRFLDHSGRSVLPSPLTETAKQWRQMDGATHSRQLSVLGASRPHSDAGEVAGVIERSDTG